MIVYISKVVLCSLLLYLVYHFFLEKERMHKFKRFYLLFAIVFSLSVPFISIHVKEEIQSIPMLTENVFQHKGIAEYEVMQIQGGTDAVADDDGTEKSQIVLIAMLVISLILLIKFLFNLFQIMRISQNAIKVKNIDKINIALIDNLKMPHSFWNTIFLNKANYEQKTIENEILTHELTHVKQKHSADVLFIELLLTLFWFNPIFYLYRRAIKLNHEFLADESVVINLDQVSNYQLILINQASNDYVTLASNFNYLITKKRLIMMTKTTLTRVITAKKVILMPFVFLLICLFSNKVIANSEILEHTEGVTESKSVMTEQGKKSLESKKTNNSSTQTSADSLGISSEIMDQYHAILKKYETTEGEYKGITQKITDEDRSTLKRIYAQMTVEQRKTQKIAVIQKAPPLSSRIPNVEEFESWKDPNTYGVWVDDTKIENTELNKYTNTDFSQVVVSKLYANARKGKKYKFQLNLMTNQYYKNHIEQSNKSKDMILSISVKNGKTRLQLLGN